MLRLQQIDIFQFKNYSQTSFTIRERVTGICGLNGTGKTSLLDAIHYLSYTYGYFSRQDQNHVKIGCSGFRIEGSYMRLGKPEKATCILRETGRKEFLLNGVPYSRFSLHFGHYPCVFIAPDDGILITGGGEERRRFLDALLSQMDEVYLEQLIQYNKILQQRNSFLKNAAGTGTLNGSLLEVLNSQLSSPGDFIFRRRKELLSDFLPIVQQWYQHISGTSEEVSFRYESGLLQASMPELLYAAREKDQFSQRTTAGIHRDDVEFRLNGPPFRISASQGQRKSLLFALKLAMMEMIHKNKGFPPILLLDDVFEKLDEERISNLLQKVCVENDGQVFITDTSQERLKQHLQHFETPFQLLEL